MAGNACRNGDEGERIACLMKTANGGKPSGRFARRPNHFPPCEKSRNEENGGIRKCSVAGQQKGGAGVAPHGAVGGSGRLSRRRGRR